MSGTRTIIAKDLNLYSDDPIQGPTPNQIVQCVSSTTFGGHGPMIAPLGPVTTAVAATLTAAFPIVISTNFGTLWPRTAGVGTKDTTGLVPLPLTYSNVSPANGFTLNGPYFKGRVVLPLQFTTSVAAPTPPTGFVGSAVNILMTTATVPPTVPFLQFDQTIIPVSATAKTWVKVFTFPFFAGVNLMTGLQFTFNIVNFDTTTTVTVAAAAGQIPQIYIDD